MVKYSIIVPFYNVEKYIIKCVSSLTNQIYNDFEIILVDDGSKDDCYNICIKEFGGVEKIRIIRQSNMGLGEARNTGIRAAQGEYLIFVDSDDFWIDDNALNKINLKIENNECDVVVFGISKFDDTNQQWIDNKKRFNDKMSLKNMICKNVYLASAWNKVIKRDFLIKNNLWFNKGLSEDMDWSARILLYTNSIVYIPDIIYAYRVNRIGSITNVNKGKLDIFIEIFNRCLKYYDDSRVEASNSNCFFIYISEIFRLVLVLYLKNHTYDQRINSFLLENRSYANKMYNHRLLRLFAFFPRIIFFLFIRKG